MTRLQPELAVWLAALAVGGSACGPGLLGELPTDTDSDGLTTDASATVGATETGEGGSVDSTSAGGGGEKGEWHGVQLITNKDLDILFVVDNSASMALAQADVGANIPGFVQVLLARDVLANVRIAVTTTDLGNPSCATTSPEDGAFVASSCAERIADFVGSDEDASVTACFENCGTASLQIQPTSTALDPTPKPRPWLESIEGITNLGNGRDDVSLTEALQCALPQGITGCEFIAPLEAARRAIERAQTPSDPAYGFLREHAHLAIMFFTDGDDCSSPFAQRAIFLRPEDCYDADGDGDATEDCTQTFWTEPSAPTPTPAVCWNAGVHCSDPMPGPDGTTSFTSCDPFDKDRNGSATTPDAAVLYPVAAYSDWFDQLRAEKAAWSDQLQVEVMGAIGVPIDPSAPIPFATSPDPAVNTEFGIGPACTAVNERFATPSVRLREVIASEFDDPNPDPVHPLAESICSQDFSSMFDQLANLMRDQIKPACVSACAADSDPSTTVLDLDCEVRQISPPQSDPTVISVPECLEGDALPPDVDVCWKPLTAATNEFDSFCADYGWNLELRLIRRDGHPAEPYTEVEISCVWTDSIDGQCPSAG